MGLKSDKYYKIENKTQNHLTKYKNKNNNYYFIIKKWGCFVIH